MNNTLKKLRTDDSGNSLIDVLVWTFVSGIALTLIGGALVGFMMLQMKLTDASSATGEMNTVNTQWRTTAQTAIGVTAAGSDEVTFTTVRTDGTCQEDTWHFTPANAGKNKLTVTTRRYASLEHTPAPQCSGSALPPITRILMPATAHDSAFTFTNLGGRELTFDDGTVTLAAGATQPAEVTAERWNSTMVGEATITAGAVNPVRIAQLTPQIPLTQTDAGTTEVSR